MATYQKDPYAQQRYADTSGPQFVTSRGVDEFSSVKIEESRGWRSQFGDTNADDGDGRSCCSRFKFVIWATAAALLLAGIIGLSVAMVQIHNNNQSGDVEFTPPGVLTPSSPDPSDPDSGGLAPGTPGSVIGVPPGAPPSSDLDGTLEIMQNPPFDVPAGYTALWWDEFEGTTLNSQWWNYDIGYGDAYGLWAWGNLEEQYYTNSPSNVKVSDGSLQITALKENTVLADGYTFKYTSGRLNTKGKLAVFGGMKTSDGKQWDTIRVEASIKAPQPTTGLWAAYWMLPIDLRYGVWASSGEIDIYEMKNDFKQNNMALHYGGPWPKYSERFNVYEPRPGGGSFSQQFTTATLDWSPTKISMSMNGEEQMSLQSSTVDPNGWYTKSLNKGVNSPFDIPFYFIINLAVGGKYPGNATESSVFPNTLTIDYLRVFGK